MRMVSYRGQVWPDMGYIVEVTGYTAYVRGHTVHVVDYRSHVMGYKRHVMGYTVHVVGYKIPVVCYKSCVVRSHRSCDGRSMILDFTNIETQRIILLAASFSCPYRIVFDKSCSVEFL